MTIHELAMTLPADQGSGLALARNTESSYAGTMELSATNGDFAEIRSGSTNPPPVPDRDVPNDQ